MSKRNKKQKKRAKPHKKRSFIAHQAKNMGGAGPHKDRRLPREGNKNTSRDLLHEEYISEEEEILREFGIDISLWP